MTRFEACTLLRNEGYKVELEFDTMTARINDWRPMTIGEFIAYAEGLLAGLLKVRR